MLLIAHIDLLREAFRETKKTHPFAIDACGVCLNICIVFGNCLMETMTFQHDGV